MVGKSFFMGQKFMPKWWKNPKNKKGAKLLFVMVRVTGQIEQTLQAKSQVCLDGHRPSFASQSVKRCLHRAPPLEPDGSVTSVKGLAPAVRIWSDLNFLRFNIYRGDFQMFIIAVIDKTI